jgi:hypothetical protein
MPAGCCKVLQGTHHGGGRVCLGKSVIGVVVMKVKEEGSELRGCTCASGKFGQENSTAAAGGRRIVRVT